MKDTLGLDFIARTLKTSGVLLLVAVPFGSYYYGFFPTLACLTGGVWGIINLHFLRVLVESVIRPEGIDKMRVFGLILVKFPMLYVSGYFLLTVSGFEVWHLLIGFSVPLAVMLLKALGRALLGLDTRNNNGEKLQEAR